MSLYRHILKIGVYCGKLNKESAVLRSKNYSCLIDDISEDKKQ